MGFGPWSTPSQTLEIVPEGSFFQPHPTLGYAGKPGPFSLTLTHDDTPPRHFTVTHNAEGYRITEPLNDSMPSRPEVWLLGCSFTHGYGVNDTSTYPWQLQTQFPAYHFRNFAMDGYGTYHSLLQFRELLAANPTPALVLLAYGGFHDQRNVNSRYWRKALSSQRIADGISYPYVRLKEDGGLDEHLEPIEYSPWPLMRYSALVHFFENVLNKSEDASLKSYSVTKTLVGEMAESCKSRHIPFVMAGIYDNQGTQQMLNDMASTVETIDVSKDLDLEINRILPTDGHPNAIGHKLMADRLAPLLSKKLIPQPDSIP